MGKQIKSNHTLDFMWYEKKLKIQKISKNKSILTPHNDILRGASLFDFKITLKHLEHCLCLLNKLNIKVQTVFKAKTPVTTKYCFSLTVDHVKTFFRVKTLLSLLCRSL